MEFYQVLCMPLALCVHSEADISDLHIPFIFHIRASLVSNKFFLFRNLEINGLLYTSMHKAQVMSSFIMQLFYLLAK